MANLVNASVGLTTPTIREQRMQYTTQVRQFVTDEDISGQHDQDVDDCNSF